jgi:beta-glucosidase
MSTINSRVVRALPVLLLVASLGTLGGCTSSGGQPAPAVLCSNVSQTIQNPANRLDFANLQGTVDGLVNQLSLDEKLGQMILADVTFLQDANGKIDYSLVRQFHLGGILIDANVVPDGKGSVTTNAVDEDAYLNGTMSNWQALSHALIDAGRAGRQIPLLIGTDNIHGNQHVVGEILVPHNIGLAATHDSEIVCATAFFNSYSVLQSGINWGFSPTIAVSHNFQWGRTYETLGSTPDDIVDTAANYVFGHQAIDFKHGIIRGTLATTKHLFGDGATFDGIDEGNDHASNLNAFMEVNLTPYQGGLDASVGSTMVSYSGVNPMPPFDDSTSVPMSINQPLLATYLNGEFLSRPFDGFVLSDFNGIEKAANQGLPTTATMIPLAEAFPLGVNGGIDMIMTNGAQAGIKTLDAYFAFLKGLVDSGSIPMDRVDDAVRRILAVKLALGLIRKTDAGYTYSYEKEVTDLPSFNRITTKVTNADDVKDAAYRTALIAAHESLVLLKNGGNPSGGGEVLPLDLSSIRNVVLVGEKILAVQTAQDPVPTLFQDYDNVGAQNGGWTIRWQGFEGNKFWQGENKVHSRAISILDALTAARGGSQGIHFPQYTSTTDMAAIDAVRTAFVSSLAAADLTSANTVIIAVLSEVPYAEFMGDINNPACKDTIVDFMDGCLYNLQQFKLNTYLPRQQPDSLAVDFSDFDKMVIDAVRNHDANIPMVTVLLSGRPMIISSAAAPGPLDASTAFVAAWLPGTTGGQAIVDALLGKYLFCQGHFTVANGQKVCDAGSPNTLPVDWVRSEDQLESYPVYDANTTGFPRLGNPLFEIGYGLATAAN